MLENVVHRRFHKRVFEWSLGEMSEPQRHELAVAFSAERRGKTRDNVQDALVKALRKKAAGRAEKGSFVRDEALEAIAEVEGNDIAVSIDCPLRGWSAEGEVPRVLPDYKRKAFEPSMLRVHRESQWWVTKNETSMKHAAMLRVF